MPGGQAGFVLDAVCSKRGGGAVSDEGVSLARASLPKSLTGRSTRALCCLVTAVKPAAVLLSNTWAQAEGTFNRTCSSPAG